MDLLVNNFTAKLNLSFISWLEVSDDESDDESVDESEFSIVEKMSRFRKLM